MVYRMRNVSKLCLLVVFTAATVCVGTLKASAHDEAANAADKPKAVTSSDPKIPVDHLKLLVKPLTKEELLVEADAWRDLLKSKVQEIAEQQIAVKDETAETSSSRLINPDPHLRSLQFPPKMGRGG